jgi:hypothetical protein
MEKKILISELNRMREMMGLSIISENRIKNLLVEGDGTKGLSTLGLGSKSVDNLTKAGIDAATDLSKLSDDFVTLTGKANPTMDDFLKVVGDSLKKNSDELSDAEITAFVKKNTELYDSILKKASDEATKIVDNLMKNTKISDLFTKAGKEGTDVYNSITKSVSAVPSKRNIGELSNMIDLQLKYVDDLIANLEKQGTTVPDELKELQQQLLGKKQDCLTFKGVSDDLKLPPPPDLTVINAKLGESFGTSETKIINDLVSELDKLSDDELNNVFNNVTKPIMKGEKPKYSSGYLSSGGLTPDKIENFANIIASIFSIPIKVLNKMLSSMNLPEGARKTIVWIIGIGVGLWAGSGIINWAKGGGIGDLIQKTKDKDIVDSPDRDCLQDVLGFSECSENEKNWLVNNVGCKWVSKDLGGINEGNNQVNLVKSLGGGKIAIGLKNPTNGSENIYQINERGTSAACLSTKPCFLDGDNSNTGGKKYACKDGTCIEDTNGTYTDSLCNNECTSNEDDENPEDENTNCKLTSSKVGSYCSTNDLTCNNISIDTDDCTATWTDEDGEQVTYTASQMGLD